MADDDGDGDDGCGMRTADDDRTVMVEDSATCTRWHYWSDWSGSLYRMARRLHLIVCLIGPGLIIYIPHM